MLFCLPVILSMLCFNFVHHGKRHEILPVVGQKQTNKSWVVASFGISPPPPCLIPPQSCQGAASPTCCWAGVSSYSERDKPDTTNLTATVHGATFVFSILLSVNVSWSPQTQWSPFPWAYRAKICIVRARVWAQKKKDITRKWLDPWQAHESLTSEWTRGSLIRQPSFSCPAFLPNSRFS